MLCQLSFLRNIWNKITPIHNSLENTKEGKCFEESLCCRVFFKITWKYSKWIIKQLLGYHIIYQGYSTVAQRYDFYFRVAKQYFTNERSEWVKCCFCHEKLKFISSSRHVMFFLLFRQNDINKIIERNYQNYVIDKLTCEIMENKPVGSRM